MARVVPSSVARIIEAAFPWAGETLAGRNAFDGALEQDQAPNVSMILALAEQLPPELLPENSTDYTQFVAICGAMRGALSSWSGGGHPAHTASLRSSAAFGRKNPIVALLDVLRRCPDEAASGIASGMEFIADASARDDLRIDIANAHRALGNGEYKAATVLAGAVCEALLLWHLQGLDEDRLSRAIDHLASEPREAGRKQPDKRGIERWHLSDFIAVALAAKVIDETTATGARLTNDFRNLIHPGRVLRTGLRCDQSTALAALSAMERLASLRTGDAA